MPAGGRSRRTTSRAFTNTRHDPQARGNRRVYRISRPPPRTARLPLGTAFDRDILRLMEPVCYIYVLTMEAFRLYVAKLEELLGRSTRRQRDTAFPKDLDAALDGQPSAELRRQVPIDVLRETGAFFTGSAMAKKALRASGLRFGADAKVLDPACGAGDLLVAMVDHLPCSADLE